MPLIIRALSIRQPFVEQILRGTKKAEFRSRPTKIRGRVYVYASLKPSDHRRAWKQIGKQPGDLPTGAIVATVEIAGCQYRSRTGEYAYVLRAPRRLRKPLIAKNQPQPGFWRPQF